MPERAAQKGCADRRRFVSYEDAEDYLRSFTDYERMVKGTAYPDDLFDLRRIEALLRRAGDPHRGLRGIHIAGTKGKGSTAIFADAILRAHGIRSGLYTSPHLVSKEERIQVDGRPLEKGEFLSWMNVLRPDLVALKDTATPPTFFDIMTTIAFLHFRASGVGAAVMEVGLGGRLDSTNVFVPDACVITSLGLDHVEKLGSTLEQIAAEKAGIIKRGVPVVSHEQAAPAARVIERKARELDAPLERLGKEVRVRDGTGPGNPFFEVATPIRRYRELRLAVLGRHQHSNAAAAIRAVELFFEREGLGPLKEERVREALAQARIPGRIEIVGRDPLIVVDGAHNPISMAVLLETVTRSLDFEDLHVVFACSRDKDIRSLLQTLAPSARRWTLTTFDFPRIEDPARVWDILREIDPRADVRSTTNPSDALEDALRRSSGADLVLCCGSFYLVGQILQVLGKAPQCG